MIKELKTKDCLNILKNNYLGHLGYICNGIPYVVPITYYYDQENNCLVSYSSEGYKIKAMRNRRTVLVHASFEELFQIDAKYELHEFAKGIKSIIEKKENYKPSSIGEFSTKLHGGGVPVVYRLNIGEVTGRKRE